MAFHRASLSPQQSGYSKQLLLTFHHPWPATRTQAGFVRPSFRFTFLDKTIEKTTLVHYAAETHSKLSVGLAPLLPTCLIRAVRWRSRSLAPAVASRSRSLMTCAASRSHAKSAAKS